MSYQHIAGSFFIPKGRKYRFMTPCHRFMTHTHDSDVCHRILTYALYQEGMSQNKDSCRQLLHFLHLLHPSLLLLDKI